MLTIALQFPAGRFHATPWENHVNEGLPEWPPSPWRFLRALVATWKRKLADHAAVNGHLPHLLGRLAAPPSFSLPAATLGNTRPSAPLKSPRPGERANAADAFVALDPEAELLLLWPNLELGADERRVLALVLSQLGIFGRAESWCTARLLSSNGNHPPNCAPLARGPATRSQETVRVLAANSETWSQWGFGRSARRPEPPWNLLAETADLHADRWSDPPGSLWVPYARPADSFALRKSAPKPRRPSQRTPPTLARYALDASVLPSVSETLPFADIARRTLLGCFQRVCRRREQRLTGVPSRETFHSATLSGKDAHGFHLTNHRHAYYLPTDEDGDGRIDHLNVLATEGFDEAEVAALDVLRRVRFSEEERRPPQERGQGTVAPEGAADADEGLRLVLVGLGQPADFNVAFLGCARRWVSATPFLASRHFKERGQRRDPVELRGLDKKAEFAGLVLGEELVRLAAQRPEVATAQVEMVEENRAGARGMRPLQFKRFRRKTGDDGGRRAAGAFRLTFAEPVRGPFCLGHSAHFGMGLFVPEADD